MIRKLIGWIIICLIFMGILYLGGTTIKQFATDIQFKNPVEVFMPLAEKLGINISLPIGGNTGSIIVSAEETDKPIETSTPIETDTHTENPTAPIETPTITPIDTTSPEITDTPIETEQPVNTEQPIGTPNTQSISTIEELNTLIASIRVSSGKARSGYDREVFEKPTHTYEYNGRKYNRHDYAWVTSEYLVSEEPFNYHCPYTGLTVDAETKLDFDHIIALGYVYKYGEIEEWSNEKCNEYAYSQNIGVDVWYKSNRSKGDKAPADWLPDVNIEDYCYTWLCIASEWGIALRQADIDICNLYCINAIRSGNSLSRID
jgi:hypothetical protein